MAKDKVSIEIEVRKIGKGLEQVKKEMAALGSQVKVEGAKIRAETSRMNQGFKQVSSGISSVKKMLVGLGAILTVKKLAGDFMDTARSVERMGIQLRVLLGSVEEGKRLFEAVSEFARRVPFELRDVMEAATALGGIAKAGYKEIMAWLPLIADLAAARAMDLQIVTSQVMRMLSAGAASADYFREKGVLAMLGFQAGVRYTAEETKKILWEAWTSAESRFRGATNLMAKSWDGMISMMRDAWFQFQKIIMEAGVFDYLKAGLSLVLRKIDELKEKGQLDKWAKETAEKVIGSLKGIAYAIAAIGDAFRGWEIIINGLRGLFYMFIHTLSSQLANLFAIINKIPGLKGTFDDLIQDLVVSAEKAFGKLIEIELKLLQVPEANLLRMRQLFNEIEREVAKLGEKAPAAGPVPGPAPGDMGAGIAKEAEKANESLRKELIRLTKTKLEQLEIWRQEMLAIKGVNKEYVDLIYNIRKQVLERKAVIASIKEEYAAQKEIMKGWEIFDEMLNMIGNTAKETAGTMKATWEGFQEDMAWSLEAGLFDVFKNGFKDLESAAESFLNMLTEAFARAVAKMISEWLIFKAITQLGGAISGLFGGGGGGTAVIAPPTQYGGVFTRPTTRLIGEAGPEAVIPLAGGRIPVEMRREKPSDINIYLVDERAKTPTPTKNDIVLVVSDDIQRDGVIRKTIKRFT